MSLTIVLFAGHRVDEPGRAEPRFPPECEPKVRAAIHSAVASIAAAASGRMLAIAGAADGGDILFHEVCAELGIESEICLALPIAEYIRSSVRPSWTNRLYRLLQTNQTAILEAGSGDVWLRDHEWQLQRARDRHPQRTVLVALLDEMETDNPGGTSGMVRLAEKCGLTVIRLDAGEICAEKTAGRRIGSRPLMFQCRHHDKSTGRRGDRNS